MTTIDPVPNPIFMLSLSLPLSKEFLRGVQAIAMAANPLGVTSWADVVNIQQDRGPTYYLTCHDWAEVEPSGVRPDPLAVDLYTIQRGLTKIFEPQFDPEIPITDRITVFRAALMQQTSAHIGAAVLSDPLLLSRIVQLSLFNQIIY